MRMACTCMDSHKQAKNPKKKLKTNNIILIGTHCRVPQFSVSEAADQFLINHPPTLPPPTPMQSSMALNQTLNRPPLRSHVPQHHKPSVKCQASKPSASYGIFICSGSPEVAEAIGAAGPDWVCLDAQHGAVPYDRLKFMLCAAGSKSKKIVRVGGPTDRFGIQQALE